MAEILKLEDVSKSFGSLLVTNHLTVSLREGEALGVIGPNGAGKTTMFNLIGGDLRPSSGRVQFDGADVTSLSPDERCRRGIGRTYQIPHPFAGMTVFENVLVGATFGRGLGEKATYAEAYEILDRTGLLPKANELAGRLPLLGRKRLELARALATKPKILLLDEIAGGLTVHEVHELIETVKFIHRSGVSIIWIEHVVHALLAVVDRLVALSFGKLLIEGEPKAVMASDEVRDVYMGVDV
jgi:branched-chain amino acid transport system ATP-binding protein